MNVGERIEITKTGGVHFVGVDRHGFEEFLACRLPDFVPLRTFAGENARERAEAWLIENDERFRETAEQLRDKLFPPQPEVAVRDAGREQRAGPVYTRPEVITLRTRRGRRVRVMI